MKSRILIFVIFIAVVFSFGAYSAKDLYSYRDDLTLKQEVIKGSIEESDKISLDFVTSDYRYKSRLEANVKFSSNPDYSVAYLKDYVAEDNPYAFVSSYDYNWGYGSSNNNVKKSLDEFIANLTNMHYLPSALVAISEEVINSKEKEKDFRLIDYTENIPLYIHSDFELFPIEYKDQLDQVEQSPRGFMVESLLLEKYFRFPVKSDMIVRCGATYNGREFETRGAILPPYDDLDIIKTFSYYDKAQNAILMSFADSSLYNIPDEYNGIFRLPLIKFDIKDEEMYCYDEKSIEKVYTLSEDEAVYRMLSGDNGVIYLVTKTANKTYLSYISSSDYTLLYKVDVSSKSIKDDVFDVRRGENGILVVYDSGNFSWLDDKRHDVSIYCDTYRGRYLKDFPMDEVFVEEFKTIRIASSEDKIYILENKFEYVLLTVIDAKGNETVVKYSFPRRKIMEEKLSPESGYDDIYRRPIWLYRIDEIDINVK